MPLETDQPQGFEFSLTDEINSGIWFTDFTTRIPLWANGDNIRFTDFGVEPVKGRSEILATASGEPIRGITQIIENTNKSAIFGDLAKLYKWDFGDTSETTVGGGYTGNEFGGATVWDSGTTTWDSGSTTWDEGVNEASVWDFTDFGSFVLATNNKDVPQIRTTNVEFNNLQDGVTNVVIDTPGTGYAVSEALTFTGGGGSGAAGIISAIGGSGEITEITITDAGSGYTSAPTVGFTTTSGSGGAATAYVSNFPETTVKVFVTSGPHVLGFNVASNSRKFIWCSADDLDDWVATSTNTAGALIIREASSQIRCVAPLGNALAVYTEDQMFVVQYVGLPNVFGYRPAIDGIGAVSHKAVQSIGSRNFGLSSQGFYETDGVQFNYIDAPIKDYFQDNIAVGEYPQVYSYHNEQEAEIEWTVPFGSSIPSRQFIYNYEKGTWSTRTTDLSSYAPRRVFNNALSGSYTGELFNEETTQTDDGAAITSSIRTKPVEFGDADRIKQITSIRIGHKGSGLQFRLGWSETSDGVINWQSYQNVSAGFSFQPVRIAGRYIYLELYSDTATTWDVQDITVQGRFAGTR
jgi:hypothetical protein